MRYPASEKLEIIRLVEHSHLPIKQTLDKLGTRHQRENECIAYFFMGQLSLINGDTKAAAEYFQKTLATGVTNFRQYTAARVELERIQK